MAALPITPSPFYAHLSRLRFIKRWGLMRNAVEEDVAQHSWDVAVLAHALAVISRDVFGQAVDPHAVATRAMRHATANLEGQVCNEMLNLLPPVLLPALRSVMDDHSWPPEEARLIKSADRLAAWLKCRAELRYGNREFEQATQQVRAKIEEHMSPEVRYFLDTFGPAFELTLDSLMQGA